MRKKSKHQGKAHQAEEEKTNVTKKRKRSQFEQSKIHKFEGLGASNDKSKGLVKKLQQISVNIVQDKKNKRIKRNNSGDNDVTTNETTHSIKPSLSTMSNKKNLNIKQVITIPIEESKHEDAIEPKRSRGRPSHKKPVVKQVDQLMQEEVVQVNQSRGRPRQAQVDKRLQVAEQPLDLSINDAKIAQRSKSVGDSLPSGDVVEYSITNAQLISQLDSTFFGNANKKLTKLLKHKVVYQSDDQRNKCNKLFMNGKQQIQELPSDSEIESDDDHVKTYESFLQCNPDVLKTQKELMKRKNKIKEELLRSECLIPIYRQYEPIKQKKEKLKKAMKQRGLTQEDQMELKYDNDSDNDFDALQLDEQDLYSQKEWQGKKSVEQPQDSKHKEQWVERKKVKDHQVKYDLNTIQGSSDSEIGLKDLISDERTQRIIPQFQSNMNAKQFKHNIFTKGPGQGGKPEKPVILPAARIEMKNDELMKRQHKFQTEGHTVYFPFPPYNCQVDFMSKLIKALNTGENALLESPTGTGKTLSLLCSSLAWLKANREKDLQFNNQFEMPRIIYTSRTHSQLAQVQRELKNTGYAPRSVVIGSRDHLCVHPENSLLRGNALNQACIKSQKGLNPCSYFKNRDVAHNMLPWDPMDIEELHNIAKVKLLCPYYGNRDRVTGADIIFMPYNYLIDEKIRENYKVNYKGSIIIFDEAHNASSTAEEVSSFQIIGKNLDLALHELQKLQDERRVQDEAFMFASNEEDVDSLIQMTRNFYRYLEEYELDQKSIPDFRIDTQYLNNCLVMPGKYIFEIFQKGTECIYPLLIFQFNFWIEQNKQNSLLIYSRDGKNGLQLLMPCQVISLIVRLLLLIWLVGQQSAKPMLDTWYDIVKQVTRLFFKHCKDSRKNSQDDIDLKQVSDDVSSFYVYIQDEEDQSNKQLQFNSGKQKKRGGFLVEQNFQRKLSFMCFNAGIAFKDIQSLMPRSIILTSGTLSPLNSFQAELQIIFNQRLENPHVIAPEQVSINILTRGLKDHTFNFSYQNRDNENVMSDLGFSIASIAEKTPGGMLIFFPSYFVMSKCDEIWDRCQAKSAMEKYKKVYMEPRDPSKYQATMDSFYKSIFKPTGKVSGSILMGVCRGRISEGLDFSDNAARCVMVIGIPYPQMTDAKVILKKDYLDKKCMTQRSQKMDFSPLSGKDWYSQQATRAVNQAIGRVIRHVQDYGSIILIDERYNWGSMRSQISKWLRDRIKVQNSCQDLNGELGTFFTTMKSRGFKPKVEQLGQIQLEMDTNDGGLAKKIQSQNSEDEETKSNTGLIVSNIFNKKINMNTDLADKSENRGTISRFFKSGATFNPSQQQNMQKRTLADVNEAQENTAISKQKITERQYSKKKMRYGGDGSSLGFCSDLPAENFAIAQDPEVQQTQTFGLRSQKIESSKELTAKIASYSYDGKQSKPFVSSQTAPKGKEVTEMKNQNQSLNEENQSMSSNKGLHSSNNQQMENKQAQNKLLIDGFKKILDKQAMTQLVQIIQEFKKEPTVVFVFPKLRQVMFGNIKSITGDRQLSEKLKLLEDLGEVIPSAKRADYQQLLADLKQSQ